MIDDQMIEIFSYLYEDFSFSERNQMIKMSLYLYENCLFLDDNLFSNRFNDWWYLSNQKFSNRFDDNLSISDRHVENFFRVWIIDHDHFQLTDLRFEQNHSFELSLLIVSRFSFWLIFSLIRLRHYSILRECHLFDLFEQIFHNTQHALFVRILWFDSLFDKCRKMNLHRISYLDSH